MVSETRLRRVVQSRLIMIKDARHVFGNHRGMIASSASLPDTSVWRTLTATPHRTMFFLGALQLVAAMALWLGELGGRAGLLFAGPLPFVLVSTWAHVLLMVYTLFVFFIYGFLFTVFPRWMGGPEIARTRYVTVALIAILGIAAIYAGLVASRTLLALGVALHLAAWLLVTLTLATAYRRGAKRGVHEQLLLLELTLGAAGLAAFLYGVVADNQPAFAAAQIIGLWCFFCCRCS